MLLTRNRSAVCLGYAAVLACDAHANLVELAPALPWALELARRYRNEATVRVNTGLGLGLGLGLGFGRQAASVC